MEELKARFVSTYPEVEIELEGDAQAIQLYIRKFEDMYWNCEPEFYYLSDSLARVRRTRNAVHTVR